MRKTTLVLITIAALGFGGLVGLGLVDSERGIDPQAPAENPTALSTGGAPAFRYLSPADVPEDWPGIDAGSPFSIGENFVSNDATWKSDTLRIDLPGDSRVEYKIIMSQGDAVVYNWSVDGEEVYYDFHAHDDAFGDEFFTRYEDGYGRRRSGVFVAPYTGQHGWYWQNLEPDSESILLEVAGFFDEIVEINPEED